MGDGEVLAVRSSCNEGFYQKTVNAKEILTGLVPMPRLNKDFDRLVQLLNDWCEMDDTEGKDSDDELDLMDTTPIDPDINDDQKNIENDIADVDQMALSDMNEEDALSAYMSGFQSLAKQNAMDQKASKP